LTLNNKTGLITSNSAVIPAGTNGSINVFVTDATDVFIDINGSTRAARGPQGPPGPPGPQGFWSGRQVPPQHQPSTVRTVLR
jgi:hypothetical protein